jgi:hypothetical protein
MFGKTSDVATPYLFQIKSSDKIYCAPDTNFNCPMNGDYKTGTSLSHATTNGVNVGSSARFFGIGKSFNYDHIVANEIGSSNSFSQSYSLGVSPGTAGYLTFTA